MATAAPRTAVDDAPPLPTQTLLEAIARRLCVSATYNRTVMTLAPYILYTRHDELFVDAVALERDGKKPKELKLGTFKLSGLGGAIITNRAFSPEPAFDAGAERYAGTTLFTVER